MYCISEGLCSLALCFCSNTKLEFFWGKNGVCSLSQNCHQLFFIFSTFLSSCFYVYFSNSDPWISEMKSAPWEPFQLLCILVLFLCPFADVCPQDPWGFHCSCERAGKCVLITPAPLEIGFLVQTPPEACQETRMNSVGSYESYSVES